MSALNTDLYELTMAAGYFAAGKTRRHSHFRTLRAPLARTRAIS